MMNRISLSSFAFLIILLILRIELCYGRGLSTFGILVVGIVVGVPICCIITCCICCCFYFDYKRRKADPITNPNDYSVPRVLYSSSAYPTNPLRPTTSAKAPVPITATPQNTVNNRTSNSSISPVDHPPRRRTLSASRSVDNTHSTNLSPQRADSPTQIDMSPPSVINTQLPIAPLVYPTVSPPSYEEATLYPVTPDIDIDY